MYARGVNENQKADWTNPTQPNQNQPYRFDFQ